MVSLFPNLLESTEKHKNSVVAHTSQLLLQVSEQTEQCSIAVRVMCCYCVCCHYFLSFSFFASDTLSLSLSLSLSMLVMAFVLILCHYLSAICFDFQACSTRTEVHHHHVLLGGNGTASSSSESLQLFFLITSNILMSFYPVTFFLLH